MTNEPQRTSAGRLVVSRRREMLAVFFGYTRALLDLGNTVYPLMELFLFEHVACFLVLGNRCTCISLLKTLPCSSVLNYV